jgi:hypothetical protein
MPFPLPDVDRVCVIYAANVVDRCIVVLKQSDPRLVHRAIISEQVNPVRNHGDTPSPASNRSRLRGCRNRRVDL